MVLYTFCRYKVTCENRSLQSIKLSEETICKFKPFGKTQKVFFSLHDRYGFWQRIHCSE